MFSQAVAIGCVGWYAILATVTTIGTVQIFRHYLRPPHRPVSSHLQIDHVPHVTIIRPCKGLEPFLYDCLAAIFHQDYPRSRLTVHFCVSSRSDAAYAILQQLVRDYSEYDTRIFIEDDDPVVQGQNGGQFGPNPKIRNMSAAYREAKGDIVWILDCNIWVGYGALGRLLDKLCGFTEPSKTGQKAQMQRPYKLVAHLPVCIDVDNLVDGSSRHRGTASSATDDPSTIPLISTRNSAQSSASNASTTLTGSMLEMSFLSTAHAKMYIAINSVSIAPCINGKSTAFRKSHLDYLTQNQGIDYFSHNICEDHLIGDLLWKSDVPAFLGFENESINSVGNEIHKSNPNGLDYGNHGLAVGDLAIQPIARMSITSYIARRVRWLRVRKFTVTLATLVEPCTESLVATAIGAYGITTVTAFQPLFGSSWVATAVWYVLGLCYWTTIDWFVSGVIQSLSSVEVDVAGTQHQNGAQSKVPAFARPRQRRFPHWFLSWIGRETLALPIWTWAIWGGTTVTWRERRFWVGMDMRVHEVHARQESRAEENNESSRQSRPSSSSSANSGGALANSHGNGKSRKVA